MRRLVVLALAAVAAVVLAGCYGSTEPATNVTYDGATLNARGTANNGPASSWFEYWATADPSSTVKTYPQSWPAGASGPFSATVSPASGSPPLYAGTDYSFRMCGQDQGVGPVCAQTRTFRTTAPTRDAVEGSWVDPPDSPHSNRGSVYAVAGPSGPSGNVQYAHWEYDPYGFKGPVTCLSVSGNRAVVGSVGQVTYYQAQPIPATLLATLVDGGPGAVDQVGITVTFQSSTPPDCSSPTG